MPPRLWPISVTVRPCSVVELLEALAHAGRRSAPSGRCCARGATRAPSSPGRAASSAAAPSTRRRCRTPAAAAPGAGRRRRAAAAAGASPRTRPPRPAARPPPAPAACGWRADGPVGPWPQTYPDRADQSSNRLMTRPPGSAGVRSAGRLQAIVDRGYTDATAQWPGRLVHLQRAAARADAHHVDQRLRPVDRAGRRGDVQRDPRPPRGRACTSPGRSARRSCGCRPTSTTRSGSRTASSTSSTTSATSPCPGPATGASSASRPPGSTPARSTCRSRCGSCTSSRASTTSRACPKGAFGFVLKVHHAAVDGKSGVEMITRHPHPVARRRRPAAAGDAVAPGGRAVAAVAVRPGDDQRRPHARPGDAPGRPR